MRLPPETTATASGPTTVTSRPRPAGDRLLLGAVNAASYLLQPRLTWAFRRHTGRWPNAARPRTLHEKYLWRKLFDRAAWQTELSDKLKAKDFVRRHYPGVGVPETLWVGTDIADCPDGLLEGDVAVKANHGCGFNDFIIGGRRDAAALVDKTRRWMATDYSRRQGQWAYRGIERKLFVEQLLIADGRLVDCEYKVHVANGRAVYTYVCFDRFSPDRAQSSDLLDADGALIPGAIDVGTPRRFAPAPPQYRQILTAAEAIARDIDYVRCDFYVHEGAVWFSEATVYSAGGYSWVEDQPTMERLTQSWDIGRSQFMRSEQRGWRRLYAAALRRQTA